MLEKNFTVQGVAPHLHADHARRETLRSLMEPAPCWPDGTPRWKTPPCRAHGLIDPDAASKSGGSDE